MVPFDFFCIKGGPNEFAHEFKTPHQSNPLTDEGSTLKDRNLLASFQEIQ